MPPAPDRITDWRELLILRAALDTGLLGAFAEPRAIDDAADGAGLDRRGTRIVTTALASAGYLEAAGDDTLVATAQGRDLLAPPTDLRDPAGDVFLEARAMASHLALPDALRLGTPPDDVSGGDAPARERFMRAMRHIAGPRAAGAVAALGPPAGGARLLDVGGGPGTYARAFAAAGWSVTVLDLAETLRVAGGQLRAAGVRVVAGDATRALPDGPWAAVYLGNLVHLFDPQTAAELVARAGAAVAPGGVLAVQEVLGDLSPQGPFFGVMMLVSTEGGDAYPEGHYRGWMAAAGCPVERVVSLSEGWHHLLLGRREGA